MSLSVVTLISVPTVYADKITDISTGMFKIDTTVHVGVGPSLRSFLLLLCIPLPILYRRNLKVFKSIYSLQSLSAW